jgi:hypothetical protein
LTSIHLLLLLFPIFLFPVAVYCWALAMVNRRLRPLMVPGAWDVVGLLFASSGFLLVAGPAILTGLYSRALREWPPGSGRPLTALVREVLLGQWGLWLGYYSVIVGLAILLLRMRRRKTAIYNVDPADLEIVLTRCLSRLGLLWTRQGNRLLLSMVSGADPPEIPPGAFKEKLAGKVMPLFPAGPSTETIILDLEPFRAMCHVTLTWRGASQAVRDEVETELSKQLAEVQTRDNPSAAWLLGIAGCLFGLMFFSVLILILNAFFGHRG